VKKPKTPRQIFREAIAAQKKQKSRRTRNIPSGEKERENFKEWIKDDPDPVTRNEFDQGFADEINKHLFEEE
jgi:hypothetical protein